MLTLIYSISINMQKHSKYDTECKLQIKQDMGNGITSEELDQVTARKWNVQSNTAQKCLNSSHLT